MDKRSSSVPVPGTMFGHTDKPSSEVLEVVLGQVCANSTFIPKDKLKSMCKAVYTAE